MAYYTSKTFQASHCTSRCPQRFGCVRSGVVDGVDGGRKVCDLDSRWLNAQRVISAASDLGNLLTLKMKPLERYSPIILCSSACKV
jgi:hypothetical protein